MREIDRERECQIRKVRVSECAREPGMEHRTDQTGTGPWSSGGAPSQSLMHNDAVTNLTFIEDDLDRTVEPVCVRKAPVVLGLII